MEDSRESEGAADGERLECGRRSDIGGKKGGLRRKDSCGKAR